MAHPDVQTAAGLAELRAQRPPAVTTILAPTWDQRGGVRTRVFTPPSPRGVLIRIHGGGFAVGAPEHDDKLNDRIARACSVAVVSPQYRRAPEVTLDEAIEDCVAVAAETLRGGEPVLIGGTSAGSHLALSTALRLRDRGGDQPFALVLDCGRYDLAGTPSARAATDRTLLLTRAWLDGFAALAGVPLDDPRFSPLHADLTGLPPALVIVGELDPLLDDSLLLAKRLDHAELQRWPEAPHSFLASGTPLAELAVERMLAWISAQFSDR